MSKHSITLPAPELLLRKLLNISDTAILRIHFYPHLVRKAGQEVTPVELVLAFVAGINESSPHLPDYSMRTLFANLHLFTKALAGTNRSFELSAKHLLAQVKKNL